MNVSLPTPSAEQLSSDSQLYTTTSLFQQCMEMVAQLYSIPHFDFYLFPTIPALQLDATAGGGEGLDVPTQQRRMASILSESGTLLDPMNLLWACFRLGAPLCHLANQMGSDKPLDVPDDQTILSLLPAPASNVSKKCIYHFLLYAKETLGFKEDDIFTISELYKEDSNGFVKVMHTVQLVLGRLKKRNRLPPIRKQLPFRFQSADAAARLSLSSTIHSSFATGNGDNRAKLLAEMVETERKYYAQLQEMQEYRKELLSLGMPMDVAHSIFANLDDLLDFERRFLIAMESMVTLPLDDQRVGGLFISNEAAFSVYEVFCSNHQRSAEYVAEHGALLARASRMDARTLSSHLIKPIQRICRYPLFLKELLKLAPPEYTYLRELEKGFHTIKRVADGINESNRKVENARLKAELKERVEDWKGMSLEDFGELVLNEKFFIISGELEREYHVFLFETILICCKEIPKKRRTWLKTSAPEQAQYALKGNIYITSITGATEVASQENNTYYLKIFWRDNTDLVSFTLKCRNMEQMQLWKERLEGLIDAFWRKRRAATNALLQSTKGTRVLTTSAVTGSSTSVNSYTTPTSSAAAGTPLAPTHPVYPSHPTHRRQSSLRLGLHSLSVNPADLSTPGDSVPPPLPSNASIGTLSTSRSGSLHHGRPSIDISSISSRTDRIPYTSIPPDPTPPPAVSEVRATIHNLPSTARSLPSTLALDAMISPSTNSSGGSTPGTATSISRRQSNAPSSSGGAPPRQSLPAIPPPPPVTSPPRGGLPPPPPLPSSGSIGHLGMLGAGTPGVPDPRPLSSSGPRGSISSLAMPNTMRIKGHYQEEIFTFSLPYSQFTLAELHARITAKMRLLVPDTPMGGKWRLKYVDEEGDLISMLSDTDMEEALEVGRIAGVLHIHVR